MKPLPMMLYGTAWKEERTTDLVVEAVKQGFRAIDTACQPKHYHEKGVGEALLELYDEGFSREDFFIQTKFTPLGGQDPLRVPYDKEAPLSLQVVQSLLVSKQNLHTSYIDALLLHSPISPYESLLQVWRQMENFVHENEVHYIGISNIYDLTLLKQLYADASVKPSIIQNRFYAQTNYDKEIRAFCSQNSIVYESFWTLTANPHILQSSTMIALAKKYQATPAQILFAYLHQVGVSPLTGTSSSIHMQEDLASVNLVLNNEEKVQIEFLLQEA